MSFVSCNKNPSEKTLKNERFYNVKYWAKRFSTFMSYLVEIISKSIIFEKILKNVLDKKVITHFCVTFFYQRAPLNQVKWPKLVRSYFYTYSRENKMNIF